MTKASTLIEKIEGEVAQISAGYDADFAGQPRATRSLEKLAALIGRLREVLKQIEAIPAAQRDARVDGIAEDVRARLSTYESETQAIAGAKEAGPDHEEFARLAAFANCVFARYNRHFAGQDRGTRDLGLLTEMVDELSTIRQRMSVILSVTPSPPFQRDADVVSDLLKMYEGELPEISKGQASGTPDEQASRLAVMANAQFALYRTHFAAHSRLTRRPALLQRIIGNLQQLRAAMQKLRLSATSGKNNKANIGVVDENLRLYQSELAEIRKARQATPIADILGSLGGEANEVFTAYRQQFSSKDRRSIDLAALGVLCDKLGDLARQMADLGRTQRLEMNERNLGIVLEQLGKFEQEYTASAKVQAGKG